MGCGGRVVVSGGGTLGDFDEARDTTPTKGFY